MDSLDFLAASAPENVIKLTAEESKAVLFSVNHHAYLYNNLSDAEQFEFARCVKRYQWAEMMTYARKAFNCKY